MIELQLKLLADAGRNEALYNALKKVIKKGMTVADLGSGTGLLSFMARKLGAKTCYLYEASPEMCELSRELARRNKITGCEFINAYSYEVVDPPRADVVISETLGNFGLEEHIIEILADGKRFLKPDGAMIPSTLEQFISPVVTPRFLDEVRGTEKIGFGLNFEMMRTAALNNMFVEKIKPQDLLSQKDGTQRWDFIDFKKNPGSVRQGKASWQVSRDTTIYGFALFWKSELVPGISLSTSPFDAQTHWDQVFLPLSKRLDARKGDTLNISLKSDTRYVEGVRLMWEAQLIGKGTHLKEKILMDTNRGLA